eukprot:4899378-Prymnesium_polylepis.1
MPRVGPTSPRARATVPLTWARGGATGTGLEAAREARIDVCCVPCVAFICDLFGSVVPLEVLSCCSDVRCGSRHGRAPNVGMRLCPDVPCRVRWPVPPGPRPVHP